MRFLSIIACFLTIPCYAQIRCRPCIQRQAVKAVVASPAVQVVEQVPPQVFVINNVPSVPQGTTSYQSAYPQLSLIDVDRLALQALALQQASVNAQSEYQSATLDFVTKLVEIQRPIAELIARGEAAAKVLKEADLSAEDSPDLLRTETPSLARQYCAKCHTGDAAKAGFRLDREFDAGKALNMIATKQMPPDTDLRPDERLKLISEILDAATYNNRWRIDRSTLEE